MKVALASLALLMTFATSGALAQSVNLSGRWQCMTLCTAPPGGLAFITQNGWNLNVLNEAGIASRAWIDHPGHIRVERANDGAVYSPDGLTLHRQATPVWRT